MSSKFKMNQKEPKVTTVELRRQATAILINRERKNKRENIFNRRRLSVGADEETEAQTGVKNVRARQLEAWKRTREEAAKNNNTKKKPFIVSVVHHHVGSPYKKRSPFKADAQLSKSAKKQGNSNAKVLPKQTTTSGRVTRATTRAAKLNETVIIQKKNELPKLAPQNFKFKAPKGIAPLQMSNHKPTKELKIILEQFSENMRKSGEQKETVSTSLSITTTPSTATKRRGSEKKSSIKKKAETPSVILNARKSSIKKKAGTPLVVIRRLDYGTPKSNKKVLGAVPPDQKTDVSKYRKELDDVIERLDNLCKKWTFTQEQLGNLPNEVTDMVDVATGQTKLLIKEKLAQYRGLVDKCEKNTGPGKVTESDLQGFWEMVNLQVQNVVSKFETLDALKANNWIEPKKDKSPLKKKRGGTKISKTKPVAAKSSVRDHIAALRRAKAAMQITEPKDSEDITTLIANFVSKDTPSKQVKQPNQKELFITPPRKTYGKSPVKSNEVPKDDKQFELLRKTPTFVHTTETPKETLSKETPRTRRRSTRFL